MAGVVNTIKILILLVTCMLSIAMASTEEFHDMAYPSGTNDKTSDIATADIPNLTENAVSEFQLNNPKLETSMLKVVSKGYFYSASNNLMITIAFVLENTNNESAIKDSRYQATLYDPTGKVLKTTSGELYLILPGERVGISDIATIPEESVLDRLDIQLSQGLMVDPPIEKNPLTSSHVTFYPHTYAPKVTGFINNSIEKTVESARVTAIAYDKDANIIGGGSRPLDFVPAEGYTGVEINIDVTKDPQKVEIYPILLDYSKFTEPWPDQDMLKVERIGSEQEPYEFNAIFVIKNPSSNLTFGVTSYKVIAFDALGRILGVASEGSGESFFPGERKGVIESVNIPDGTIPTRTEVQLQPLWASNQSTISNPLKVGKVDFIDGTVPKATGTINSSWPKELQYVKVAAVVYDQNDRIIGGGDGHVSFIPAMGQAPFEIWLKLSGSPKRIEIFPSPSQPLETSLIESAIFRT
ncbi:MAG: hypothetical protein MUE87_06000 [Methanothrix sp.]|jgi:hypothetical protein|nr:hypothetical protein [Methanothrix sp.]